MKSRVIVRCWQRGHETELFLTRHQEKKLSDQIPVMKAVCPICRNEGHGNIPVFISEGATVLFPSKVYACEVGHVSAISAFANGMLHVRVGNENEDFVNIEGRVDEVAELVDAGEIVCHHEGCGKKLTAVDDFTLSVPSPTHIKTRTRLGDLWDRGGIEPVRQGTYDLKRGEYNETRTERANKDRLKKLRKRNVEEGRLPGKRIDKPTDRDYGRKSKDQIDFS